MIHKTVENLCNSLLGLRHNSNYIANDILIKLNLLDSGLRMLSLICEQEEFILSQGTQKYT